MNVNDLQRFLASVVPLARAAGASEKAATELERTMQCLDPFKDRSLTDFSEFLRRADEFDRTGKLIPPPSNVRGRGAAKEPGLSVEEAHQIFNGLVARASDPALSYSEIDAALKRIGKLQKAQLHDLAGKLDVPITKSTSGKKIVETLTRRITELKASSERTQYRFGA